MKKIIIIMVAMFMFVGCGCPVNSRSSSKSDEKMDVEYGRGYRTYVIDKCEYISIEGASGISHKGNCKNPIHSHK